MTALHTKISVPWMIFGVVAISSLLLGTGFGQIYTADFSTTVQFEHTDDPPPEAPLPPPGPQTLAGPNWTIGYDTTPSTDGTSNTFGSNGTTMSSRDFGGEAFFITDSIDVSGWDVIDIVGDGNTAGSAVFNGTSEFFQWGFILDGGSPTNGPSITSDGSLDTPGSFLGIDTSSANSLEVQFFFNVNGSGDGFDISSLVVNGITPSTGGGTPSFWDVNGIAPGVGGTGTWTSGGALFSTSTTGDDAAARTSTDEIFFDGTAGVVTVDVGGVTASGGLTFNVDGYTLDGASVTLGGATNAVTTGAGVTATIENVLVGSGGMEKSGSGTLILNGANTYTGGTTITGGTLQLGDGTTNGSVVGDVTDGIVNNGTLAFNNGTAQTYAGAISGTGALTKDGAGTLTLTAANTYSGGTTVSAGDLTGDATSLQGSITNNASVTFDQAGAGEYSGNMSGTGSLTKTGAGTLTLSAFSNSYSGGTTVSAGGLTGTTGSLQGNIVNNAAVTFDQSFNGTFEEAISGTGTVTKSGTGTVTLTGTNTYSGGTTITEGTLQLGDGTTDGSIAGNVTNDGTLAFSNASSQSYGGDISGSGAVTKSEAGDLTLSGSSSYSGGTTISGGSLTAGSNTALGNAAGLVTLTEGSLFGGDGVTVANAIEAAANPVTSLLAYWNFNSLSIGSANSPGSGGVPTSISADSGAGTLDLTGWTGTVDDFGGSSLNALFGDSAESSLSLRGNAGNGSFIEISGVDMTGLTNLEASFATQKTSTGFNSNQWSWSTDGVNFTSFGSSIDPGTSFGVETVSTSSLDGVSTVFLRYTLDGATTTGANNRIDNLQLNATGAGGSVTLGENAGGSTTFTGNVTLNSDVVLTAASSGTATFSGVVSGTGNVEKQGDGTVVLSNNNTYTGTTTVTSGTLELTSSTVNSTIGDSPTVTVASGATLDVSGITTLGGFQVESGQTLGGAGTVIGDTTILSGATLTGIADATVGTLTFSGDLTLDSGSTWLVDLVQDSNGTADVIAVSGALALGDATFDDSNFSGLYTLNNTYTIATYGTLTGTFSSWANGTTQTLGGGAFLIDYGTGTNSAITLTAVPEPTTFLLLAPLLFAGFWLMRRRRQQQEESQASA